MKAHILDSNGVIINSIEVETLDFMPGLVDASVGGNIGDVWDAKIAAFVPPTQRKEVPSSVTMRQARSALFKRGLLGKVDTTIRDLNGPDDELVRIAWEFALTIERNNYVVKTLSATLGLSEEHLDDLFILAAQMN